MSEPMRARNAMASTPCSKNIMMAPIGRLHFNANISMPQLLEDLRVYSNALKKEMFEAAIRTRKRQKAGLKIRWGKTISSLLFALLLVEEKFI